MMRMDSQHVIKVLRYIYDCNLTNEPVWISKIIRHFPEPEQSSVDAEIDYLFDLGCLEGRWERISGKWTRTIHLTDGGLCVFLATK